MNTLKRIPFHPFLFAAYPIIALLGNNIQEVEVHVSILPLLLSLATAGIVFGLLRLALKDWLRAALVASLLLLLFFSYGHVYTLLENVRVLGIFLGRHRILIPLYLVLLAGGVWWCLKIVKNFADVTLIINVIGIVAVSMPFFGMGDYAVRMAQSTSGRPETDAYAQKLTAPKSQELPDVYYIILDAHSRSDMIKTQFGYDNSAFINQLKEMGFYVADSSQSNYGWTRLSMSSSLNLNYLQDMGREFDRGSDTVLLTNLIKRSLARRSLESLGYKTVAFETGYPWTQWYDATYYLYPKVSNNLIYQMRPFQTLLTRKTALKIVFDAQPDILQGFIKEANFPYQDRIDKDLFVLDKMQTIASIPGPKFVFVHMVVPHFPFIFKADGSIQTDPGYWGNEGIPINDTYFRDGYVNQIQFIERRIIPILQQIIAQSTTPPIIVLQGDHGIKDPPQRLAILNAYYLPGNVAKGLYPTITPVNTFRTIFNGYFGTNYPLLPDKSYSTADVLP